MHILPATMILSALRLGRLSLGAGWMAPGLSRAASTAAAAGETVVRDAPNAQLNDASVFWRAASPRT